ncbi:hypothetical protein [Achromobacter xylosoxidans]|uniref:hypothetical protein n=1 Tax=Alcaligenes xylosoxydans xylosoxydans TaxID=85698 RepID=UPI0012F50350|nr:hypothetical protein [Achromobacter xylosoxidans]
MNTQDQRIAAHNNWPIKEEFKAERAFREQMNLKSGLVPFKTFTLPQDRDPTYQKCVGHFVDALEALPYRPDYFFDHCFKVIDESARPLFSKQGIKGIVQGLAGKLLASSNQDWSTIIDALGDRIPLMTCRYLAKRMLLVHGSNDDLDKQLSARIEKCMRKAVYDEFIGKFGTDAQGVRLTPASDAAINKAASYLKIYLSGKQASKTRGSGYKLLDLKDQKNIPTHHQRIEFLLSVLLFTMRNERAHGGVLSPFRTSKATLDRYESYYFAMLCAYIFALGVLSLRGYGAISAQAISSCTANNLNLQKTFFV